MSPLLAMALAMLIGGAVEAALRPKPAVPFPILKHDRAELATIAGRVESQLGMPGFAKFAIGVAQNESRFNSTAVDDSASAVNAARALYYDNLRKYGDSGFPASWYTWGTGGWYQLLPATALSSTPWNKQDPMLVFDPVASTFLLASFVQRVQANHFPKFPAKERNWLALRRFMLNNKAGYDWNEELPRTAGKRQRFGQDLEVNGIPASFMYERVPTGSRSATPQEWQRYLSKYGPA